MNKLIILISLLMIPTLAQATGKAAKAPPKPKALFSAVSVKLTSSYQRDLKVVKVMAQVQSINKSFPKSDVQMECKKSQVECSPFPDFANKKLTNLYLSGSKKQVQTVLLWVKARSQKYQESIHTRSK